MKQPYIYTMPESFLKDKNVPARWRILALINGFILNGGCFYGSNEWLMEQLACSEPTVSSAFKELEDLKEIRTERTKRTRKVYKTSRDPSSFGSQTQVEPSRDPSQLLPNSVSNSEKNTSEQSSRYVVETDQKKKVVTEGMQQVFDLFEGNPARITWRGRKHQREAAQVLYDTFGVEELRLRYQISQLNKEQQHCPQIDSPSDFLEKMPKMEKFLKDLQRV